MVTQHGQAQTEGIPNAKIIAKHYKRNSTYRYIVCLLDILFSCSTRLYCTIFEIHDESINTIRVALNIENTEILDIFETMGIFAIIIFVFYN